MTKLKTIVCFIAILFLFDCNHSMKSDFQKYSIKAQNTKDVDKEIYFYSKAIGSWLPADGQTNLGFAYINRGVAYFSEKEYEKGRDDFDKAFGLNPLYRGSLPTNFKHHLN